MIITQVNIENYMCYYGSNTFDFVKGLNVIIGENEEGKTIFFEALEWLFYGAGKNIESLVSKKKLREVDIDESFQVKVSMCIDQYSEFKMIARSFIVTKKSNRDCTTSNHSFEGLEENRKGERAKADPEILLRQIFPAEIRKYSMFKGESELDIFQNEDTLVSLVNLFAEARHYEKYTDKSAILLKEAENAVTKASKKNSQNQKKYAELETNIKNLIREKEKYNKSLNETKKEIEKLDSSLQKAEKYVDNAEALETVNNKIKSFEEAIRKELGAIKENYTTYLFDDNWILAHFESIFQEFEKKVNGYSKERRKLQREFDKEQGRKQGAREDALKLLGIHLPLPVNVPDKKIMEELIEAQHCKICNRPAPKGSEAYKHMVKKLEAYLDQQTPKKNEEENEILYQYDYISELVNKVNLYNDQLKNIRSIKEKMKELFEFNETRKAKVKELDKGLEEVKEERIEIIGSSSIGEEKAGNVLKDYNGWQADILTEKDRKREYEFKLNQIEKELEDKRKEKDEIDVKSTNLFMRKTRDILRDVDTIIKDVKEEKFDFFIELLQDKSNEYFSEINKGAFTGNIRFNKNTYSDDKVKIDVQLYEGDRMFYNPSTSHKTSMHIAILFAISKLAEENRREAYPLIFDAPTSSFGETKTGEFLNIISNTKNQIILLIKDFIVKDEESNILQIKPEFNDIKRDKAIWIRLERPFDEDDLSTLNTEVIPI